MKNLYQELPLLQQASMSKPEMTESFSPRSGKTVRFKDGDSESRNIPSYRDYTPLELRSMWYTPTEYGKFALNEVREKMTLPLDERKEKHKRMLRIDNVRRTVLKSQSYQLLESKLPNSSTEYSQWMENYVQRHSNQSAAEARQRGIENDLELLDIKMKEMASRITKRPPMSPKTKATKKTSNKNAKNARWATNDAKSPRDVAPCAIERSSGLRIDLCNDFCNDNNSAGETPMKEHRVLSGRRGRRGSIRLINRSS